MEKRCSGHVAFMGRGEVYSGFWWGNLRERSHLGTGDNIKMDLHELGNGCMDWIDLIQNRESCFALVNAVMNLHVT